eukprot:403361353
MEIWLVRHGETYANIDKIIQGQQGGELTQKGVEQAKLVSQRLLNEKFDAIYCSDLNRTLQTASHIVEFHQQTQFFPDSRLREKSGGVLEGQPLSAFKKEAAQAKKTVRDFRPPKGENWKDVMARAQAFIQEMAAIYIDGKPSPLVNQKVHQNQGAKNAKNEQNILEEEKSSILPQVDLLGIQITGLSLNGNSSKIPSSLKPKSLQYKSKVTNQDIQDTTVPLKKLLVITHGGFIMEFMNAVRLLQGKQPIENNSARNTSIYIIQFKQQIKKQIKSTSAMKQQMQLVPTVILENDNSHLKDLKAMTQGKNVNINPLEQFEETKQEIIQIQQQKPLQNQQSNQANDNINRDQNQNSS